MKYNTVCDGIIFGNGHQSVLFMLLLPWLSYKMALTLYHI